MYCHAELAFLLTVYVFGSRDNYNYMLLTQVRRKLCELRHNFLYNYVVIAIIMWTHTHESKSKVRDILTNRYSKRHERHTAQ